MLPTAALSGSRPECAGQVSSSPRGRSAFRAPHCGADRSGRLGFLVRDFQRILYPTAAVRPPRITKVHPNYLCNHDSRRTPHLLLAPPAVRNRAKALRRAPRRGCLRLGRYELREKLEGRSQSISTVSLKNLSFTANRFLCTRPVRSRRYAYTSVPSVIGIQTGEAYRAKACG